ncbi:MAG: recombination protein O N-terminal domain-containing protein [Clostridium sp.]|nr:MAG: recombination protein O N-terminal domain-containing protein [Clostridium sp.]
MEEKLNALCVRVVDYKDNDRLITLCTAEKGKILVKATGVKNPKAKLKFAASPLCFGEYIVVENKGRYTLKGCEAYDNFQDIVFLTLNAITQGLACWNGWINCRKNADTDTVRALLIVGTEALKELAYDVDVPPEKHLAEISKRSS